jgi:hypothetical protein
MESVSMTRRRENPCESGFLRLITEGFLAIPPLPSNPVPLLLRPLLSRAKQKGIIDPEVREDVEVAYHCGGTRG